MTTMAPLARIDKAAKTHGWTVDDKLLALKGKLWLSRGDQKVMVRFSQSGAVIQVKYGLFGATQITGTSKAEKVIELLAKED